MSGAGGLGLRAGRAVVALAPFAAYAFFGPSLYQSRATGALASGGNVTVSAIDRDPAQALERSRRALDRVFTRVGDAASKSGEATQGYRESLGRLADAIASQPAAPAASAESSPRRPDPERIKLELERAKLSADLARSGGAASADSSDNPFSDGRVAAPNDTALRRRIAEIDGLLSAAMSSRRPQPRAVVGTEVASLVRALPSAAPTAGVAVPAGTAGEVRTSRVAPDSTWVLVLGFFAAAGAALLPVGRRRTVMDVRPPSSRPLERRSAPPATPVPRAPSSDRAPRVSSRPPAPAPAAARVPSEPPAAASRRPSSAPPIAGSQDESPVMAYPVVWRGASAADLARQAKLRDEVRSRATRDCFVVAVTAPGAASDAKPAVAAGLSAALAEDPESRVLLVEADLQRPKVCEALGVGMIPAADLVSQLETRVAGTSDRHIYVLKCSPSLHVLPARAESPTLILSTHFESCLSALRPFYDVIVLNAPTLEDTVACRAVNDVVDGVVFVGRPPGSARAGAEHPFSSKSWSVDVPSGVS